MAKSKNVQEADDKFKCKVTKTSEDGEVVWTINELDGLWVATFHDEAAARAFAEQYPKMKADYIAKSKQIEAEKLEVGQCGEAEKANKSSDDLKATAQKLKQYNNKYVSWEELTELVDDDGKLEQHIWLKSPNGILVCRMDSNGEKATYFIVDKDNNKLVEVGHDGMKGMFTYAFSPTSPKEDIPADMPTSLESKLEKELDNAIEEGLKEIYR